MADIRTLREAVEAGTLHKEKYGGMSLATACYPRDQNGRMLPDAGGWSDGNVIDAYHGSLGAANALHDALLPGWVARPQIGGAGAGVSFWHCTIEDWESGEEIHVHNMPTPARAWLIAILKALEARANG